MISGAADQQRQHVRPQRADRAVVAGGLEHPGELVDHVVALHRLLAGQVRGESGPAVGGRGVQVHVGGLGRGLPALLGGSGVQAEHLLGGAGREPRHRQVPGLAQQGGLDLAGDIGAGVHQHLGQLGRPALVQLAGGQRGEGRGQLGQPGAGAGVPVVGGAAAQVEHRGQLRGEELTHPAVHTPTGPAPPAGTRGTGGWVQRGRAGVG